MAHPDRAPVTEPEDFDFGMDGGLRVQRPSPDELVDVLAGIFGPDKAPAVVARQVGVYESTFGNEVVTCRFGDGSVRQLLCKYGMPVAGQPHASHGHRGGLSREAAAYLDVLQPLGVSAAHCLGLHLSGSSGVEWLVLEFLDGAVRLNKSPDPEAIGLAALWLGRFHRLAEPVAAADVCDLVRHDQDYYLGWIDRTASLAGALHRDLPWLGRLCARSGMVVADLRSHATTVIHGEFYPHNVLYRDKTVYPVDWESAAVGAGELDLAALTAGWPASLARTMEGRYRQARWPDGAPAGFGATLSAARMMACFQLLGDLEERTQHESSLEVFEALRALADQAGLL